MKIKLHNRILSALLAVLMFLSCVPLSPVYAEDTETTVATDPTGTSVTMDFNGDIGKYAQLIESTESYEVSVRGELSAEYSTVLYYYEFQENTILRIRDWYWDEGTTALWYQVEVYSGGVIPESEEFWPEEPWIMQDYIDENYDYPPALAFMAVCDVCGKPDCATEHVYCDICQKYDCGIDHDATDPTEPTEIVDPNGSGVVITGNIPENAKLEVSTSLINGDSDSPVYDIKIYLEDGITEWQPIDEGKTVTISIPISGIADGEPMNVFHYIDYAPDINGDELVLPTDFARDGVRPLLQPALDAYGDGEQVAVEFIYDAVVTNGMLRFETDSFSIYDPDYSNRRDTLTVSFSSSDTDDEASGKTYYATIGQSIKFEFVYDGWIFWGSEPSKQNGKYSLTNTNTGAIIKEPEEAHVERSDKTVVLGIGTVEYTESVTYDFDKEGLGVDVNVGDVFQIDWVTGKSSNGKNPRWTRIMIIDEFGEEVSDGVKFNANGGEWTTTAADGTVLTETEKKYIIASYQPVSHVPEPTRYGYEFVGWNTAADGRGTNFLPTDTFPATVADNTVFYAQWETVFYTVNYVVPSTAGEFSAQTKYPGESIQLHANVPVGEGDLQFVGWDADGDGVKDYNPGDTYSIDENLTLVAVWDRPVYAVIYDPNGGSGTPEPQYLDKSVADGITLNPTPLPERTGYTIAGWNTSPDGTGTVYSAGTYYDLSGNLTLYAQWEPILYGIKFDKNGASGNEETKPVTLLGYNSMANLTSNSFTNGIQKFQGWALTADATSVLYTNAQRIKFSELHDLVQQLDPALITEEDIEIVISETEDDDGNTVVDTRPFRHNVITLYAVWATEAYTIRYEAQRGSIGILSQNVIIGTNATIDNYSCTRPNYTFGGWSLNPDGTGDLYQNGDPVPVGSDDQTISLYAVWYPNVAGYIGIMGSSNTITAMGTITTGDGRVFKDVRYVEPIDEPDEESPAMTLTCPVGYEIIQYYEHGSIVDIGEGKTSHTYEGGEKGITEPFNIVAIIAPINYTVTFVNDDDTPLQTGKVAYGDTPVYSGDTPTKAPDAQYTYNFKGWDSAITPVSGDVTYKATYTETLNEYTITFVDEDGTTELQTGKVAYGETPVYSGETPIKASNAQYTYTFADWIPAIKPVSGDATYTATYTETPNTCTVSFVTNGGNSIAPETVEYDANLQLPTPVKTDNTLPVPADYIFLGWYTNEVFTGEAVTELTNIQQNVTLYAKWGHPLLYNKKVRIGINMSFHQEGNTYYHSIPVEPVGDYDDVKCLRAYYVENDQTWVVGENWGQAMPNSASAYIKEDFFSESYKDYYKVRDDKQVICIYDDHYVAPKELLINFDSVFDGLIEVWADAGEATANGEKGGYSSGFFVNIDWTAVTSDNHEILPYVIKYNYNFDVWFIDVIIRPTSTYSISYVLNLDSEYAAGVTTPEDSQTYGTGHKAMLYNQGNVTTGDGRTAKFLGWYLDENNNNLLDGTETKQYAPGSDYFMPGNNVKFIGKWEYSQEITIETEVENGENHGFIFQITRTDGGGSFQMTVSLCGSEKKTIVGLPIGEYTVTEVSGWSWQWGSPSKTKVAENHFKFTYSQFGSNWLAGAGRN